MQCRRTRHLVHFLTEHVRLLAIRSQPYLSHRSLTPTVNLFQLIVTLCAALTNDRSRASGSLEERYESFSKDTHL